MLQVDPEDPNGPDIDTKMDELQEAIRKSEVSYFKYYSFLTFWYWNHSCIQKTPSMLELAPFSLENHFFIRKVF